MRSEQEIRERIAYLEGARSLFKNKLLDSINQESIDIAIKELLWVFGEWDFKTNPNVTPIMYSVLSKYKKEIAK